MIHLPTPCTLDWSGMTPVETGRHCSVCNISVTDFTQMNEAQIKDHIAKYGLHCGRFRADQVTDDTSYTGWKYFSKWKSAVATLLIGSVFMVSCRRHVHGCAAYQDTPKERKKAKTEQHSKGE